MSPKRGAAARSRPNRAVYRRRRLLVATVALLLVLGAAGGVAALAGGGAGDEQPRAAAPTASAAPSPSPTPTPAPTATAGYQPVACLATALEIAEADTATKVAAGTPVAFDITVTNSGSVPCLLEVGSARLGVVVSSGTDRIWSSTDCPTGRTERRFLLDVGAAAEIKTEWDQTRSAPGCPGGQPAAKPGTYRAVVTVDGGGTAALGWERVLTVEAARATPATPADPAAE